MDNWDILIPSNRKNCPFRESGGNITNRYLCKSNNHPQKSVILVDGKRGICNMDLCPFIKKGDK